MKITVKPIYYYGYLQGYKVYIDGKKYPRTRGHWYTTLDPEKARISAFGEHAKKGGENHD